MRGVGRALLVALLPLALGCGRSEDPVRVAIDSVVAGAEKQDAHRVVEALAPDFQAADGSNGAAVEAMLRQYFAAYESLHVEIRKLAIEHGTGSAVVRFEAVVSGMPRSLPGLEGLLPRSSTLRFEVDLRSGSDGWKISRASWSEL